MNKKIERNERQEIPIGTIVFVQGPVVKIACSKLPPLHEALSVHVNNDLYILEAYQYIDEKHVRAIALHRSAGLERGLEVLSLGAPLHVPVTPQCLGKLLNVFVLTFS